MPAEANTKRAEELLPCPGSDSCRPHLQWGAYHSPICPRRFRPFVAEALDAAEARGASRLKERVEAQAMYHESEAQRLDQIPGRAMEAMVHREVAKLFHALLTEHDAEKAGEG